MLKDLECRLMSLCMVILFAFSGLHAQTFVTDVESGAYYRIYGYKYSANDVRVMAETASTHGVVCAPVATDDYMQVWQLMVDGNQVSLKNAITGRYVNPQGGVRYSPYSTVTDVQWFKLDSNETNFMIIDGTQGLHEQSGGVFPVVAWDKTAGASQWQLEKVSVDAAELAAQQLEYHDINDLRDNAEAITASLQKYFTDATCSVIKDAYKNYSDASLTSAMTTDALPQTVINMALKVKNEAWTKFDGWDKTEKNFRVADYKAYSAHDKWTSILGNGYSLSRLTNPMGITVKADDIVTLYIGSIPEGQKLQLENVAPYYAAGSTYDLQEGFNAIRVAEAGNLFIFYSVDNTTTTPYTPIANYAPVSIHIEGGELNGYFDLTRGDTNEDWAMLQKYLLDKHESLQLKSEHLVFNMDAALVKAACPTNMVGLLGLWEKIVVMERSLMGLEEYEGMYNNMSSVVSGAASNNSHMLATTYGTFYHPNTLAGVMNYETMFAGPTLWGPAHENGHLNQKYINMIGMSEVSNNLFSNVALYENGHVTSRAKSINTTFANMAAGKAWNERDIWEQTHMYFQLYQFFHIQGFDTDFYPNLFKAFRADPMTRNANHFVPATEDFLKFYATACEVSGYDLTEFFQAYGFFTIPSMVEYTLDGTTQKAYKINDYGDHYLTVTQEMIDEAKASVAAKNYKKANIIFIEDRIVAPDATYEGAPAGAKKTAYSSSEPIGIGDVGQYTDFVSTSSVTGYFASYTENADGGLDVKVNHANASGAVGFKVYDAAGNLVYLANSYDFTIPANVYASLKGTAFTINAAGASGADQQMEAGEHYINWIVKDEQGNVLKTVKEQHFVGDAISAYPTELNAPFLTITDFSKFSYSEPIDKILTAKISVPFMTSTETSQNYYYYLKVRNGYLYENDATAPELNPANGNNDNYRWAIYGNPYEGYRLQNKATGSWLNAGSSHYGGQKPIMSDAATSWTIVENSSNANSFALKVPTANSYVSDHGGKGNNFAYYGLDAGCWIVPEHVVTSSTLAPFSIGDQKGFWGTFYSDSNRILPEGVKAYRATYANDITGELTLAEVQGSVLAGGEGYLIYTTESRQGIVFDSTTKEAERSSDNMLRGSETAATFQGEGTYYIFSRQTQSDGSYKFGFFWQNGTAGKGVSNGAYKAYLLIPSASVAAAKGYTFVFDQTTSVSGVKSDEGIWKSDAIYNLAGQRVGSSYKGIVIKNGKKVVQ